MRLRNQRGCLRCTQRKTGPSCWEFLWREHDAHGNRTRRTAVIGTVEQFPTRDLAPCVRMFLALRRNAGSYGLSSSMDRWRGLCRAVIQVEAKLELSRIRHEAGMPWRIEHDFHMNFLDTGQP
jgi:hypothetical protein